MTPESHSRPSKAAAQRACSANEVFESLEAAVEVSRRVVAGLPALSAIILGKDKPSGTTIQAQVISADRWLSSTITELEAIEPRLAPRSRQHRGRELLEETRGLHLVVKDRLERMEQLWSSESGALSSVPRLTKSDSDQLHVDMMKLRKDFWQKLFAVPCVARQRVSELRRCLAGEIGIRSEVFTIPTDTRCDDQLLSDVGNATSFFDEQFGADSRAKLRNKGPWIALGKMLANLPCLPEAALERAKTVAEKVGELEEISLALGCRAEATVQGEKRRTQKLLEDDLGGGALECRGFLKELLSLRMDYLEIRNYIYLANMSLAVTLTRCFVEVPHNRDDLHQAGRIGLLKGIERFDPKHGSSFSTFASFWIRQMCMDERGNVRANIKVPGYARSFFMALIKLPDESLRALDISQVAKDFSLKLSVARAVQKVALGVRHLGGSSSGAGGEVGIADLIADHRVSESAQVGQQQEAKELTDALMSTLEEREREIVKLRFGIGGGSALTLREIAERCGLSRERVRQVLDKVLTRFRSANA